MTAPLIADVAHQFGMCAKSFNQLAAILKTIEAEAKDDRRLIALAGAGRYIADDMANLADCWETEIEEHGICTSAGDLPREGAL